MTYTELKTALKSFQAQGKTIPALNSKKEVLENALAELQALVDAEADLAHESGDMEAIAAAVDFSNGYDPEYQEIAIDTPAPQSIPENNPESIEENAPEVLPQVDTLPFVPTPCPVNGWQLVSLEIKDDLKFVGTVMIWAIALIRSIIRFTSPYLVRACHKAFRWGVYGAVAFRIFILPKILIALYYLGIWGVTIALRVVHSRRWSIA